jgi:phosphate transport system substrate-binding protein
MRLHIIILFIFFSSCADDKSIKIKGSDTEVNLAVQLAESFHNDKPDILISVSGGGSGLGIASLFNGNADIANSSRRINEEETSLFRERAINIDSFIFAQDAIAFVVSDHLPLDSINTEQLAAILSGKCSNWSCILKEDVPINIYGRQSNSGTHDFVQKRLNIHFSPHAKQMNGNAQILEAVRSDASGIGYVGAGYVMNGSGNGIKVLLVYSGNEKAISPLDEVSIISGKYFFQRPLYQYYQKADYQKLKQFLDFEKTETGTNIIRASGYYLAKNEYE